MSSQVVRVVAALLAVAVIAVDASAQQTDTAPAAQRPTYQRRPVGNYPHHGRYNGRGYYHGGQWQAPSVASGSFTRPYPYHLDYYKQRYNGGYEPYFGNLYGSPRVVGTQPFAFSQYPNQGPVFVPEAAAAPAAVVAPAAGPAAESVMVCPHCGQAMQLMARPAYEAEAGAAVAP